VTDFGRPPGIGPGRSSLDPAGELAQDGAMGMHPGQVGVDAAALTAAIAEQVPGLAGLPVHPLESAGTVVAPFRIGERHLARVPLVPSSDPSALVRLEAEAAHARFLADRLPVEVPQAVHLGEPFAGYPGCWSVWTWVDGTSLDRTTEVDQVRLADDLARLLLTFHGLPTQGRSWNRAGRGGRPLADTDWVRSSIGLSAQLVDAAATTAVWERALSAAPQRGAARYIHGDPVPGNLIIRDGRLAGLVDITEPSIGDPAADLVPAWAVFEPDARRAFRAAMNAGDDAWERGRGWAFEMAIGALHYYEHTNPVFFAQALRTLQRLLES
jgi:aminoglycoside phosphotransferase (APT) family kinase protein